jgi:hypothetical protein
MRSFKKINLQIPHKLLPLVEDPELVAGRGRIKVGVKIPMAHSEKYYLSTLWVMLFALCD